MFIARRDCRGFTLLEITLAVAILATMSFAIYRFVQSNLVAIRLSSDTIAADARYDALRDLLASQWESLPSGKPVLWGDAFKLNDRERDEIRWVCGAGPGLLTRYAAAGDYVVTLRLQAHARNSDQFDLGFRREPKDDSGIVNENVSWVPLVEGVQSMRIQYFSSTTHVWQESWPNAQPLPQLVKLVIQRNDTVAPWEVIIPVHRTPWQQ